MKLVRKRVDELAAQARLPVDPDALSTVTGILERIERGGEAALRAEAQRLGDLEPGAPLAFGRAELETARDALSPRVRGALERAAERIRGFALAQRAALTDVNLAVPGGTVGHRFLPVRSAGCYAPGGRFPLVSSVLMTAVTARAAGVASVWVASPRPPLELLAAAAIAGADGLLAVGGAQALGALTFGLGGCTPADVLCGPGNRYVTAAKFALSQRVGIDLLAGPSELCVVADGSAAIDARAIALDLAAQAEHDPEAWPVLITLGSEGPPEKLIQAVEAELATVLVSLSTAATARRALEGGWAVIARNEDEALAAIERLAPEHLHLVGPAAETLADRARNYGALFVGAAATEALGDYGIGPNHVLPTGGTARHQGGLSVLHFLRARTRLTLSDPSAARDLFADTALLARLEGLEAHALSAAHHLK